MSQVTGDTAEYVKIVKNDPCVYCGAPAEHIDHVEPFSAGGVTHWSNLAPACATCNYRKSKTPLLSFLLKSLPVYSFTTPASSAMIPSDELE